MDAITYRDATPADAECVAELARRSFAEAADGQYAAEDLAYFLGNYSKGNWELQLEDRRFSLRLAEAGGNAVGFCDVGPQLLPIDSTSDAAELRHLYVLSPWHGTGVAPTLMEWALAEARGRGADEVYLSVYAENAKAQRFYGRYGFVEAGRYGFDVGTQTDEDIIMRLRL